ncbi:MAG: 3-dehydroquinate dehydratase [Marinilabiliales bacterium]|nr:MAG: 3-dehydroquinate dehydratase [Marinilabiliales bacterium]
MRLHIINGPNLNNIGRREPNIYGNISFSDYLHELKNIFDKFEISYSNSHFESDLVDLIHQSDGKFDGIILNAGAYSHTSVAIRDAVAAIKVPVVLVHISNVYAREPFRNRNMIAPVCEGIITGFGLKSYEIAIKSFVE